MPANPDEIARREAAARDAIRQAYDTGNDDFGATLFVSHHLDELDSGYWSKHLSTKTPEPRLILDLLVLRSHWGGNDEIDTFDFALPDHVSDYVISTKFNETGDVCEIAMES